MHCKKVILASVILAVAGTAYAQTGSYGDAQRLYDSGSYEQAEGVMKGLIAAEPDNAKYSQLLGDVLRREGRYNEALVEYGKAKKLGADNPELYKGIASAEKRLKRNRSAVDAYTKALRLDPNDREAKEDLASLEKERGLKLTATIGGAEADYTTDRYEAALSYGALDKLDLNAGYSYADNIYYTRDKFYASGYYFYRPDSYFKVYAAHKNYDYPEDPLVQKPNPDTNSYDAVPTIEFEVSHWLTKDLRGSVAYEYFRPTFFYDQDSTANNHKVSAEVYYITPLPYLRLKAMLAFLRDPDSDTTEIKGRDNLNTALGTATATDVHYKTSALLGGGAELSKDKWNAEFKYLPNRDLDDSYDYSILAGVGYDFTERLTGRFDYVYDSYSSQSSYPGETANVYLVSGFYKINQSMDMGAGVKHIELPTRDDNAGFITLSYKTGLGF